MKKNLPETDLLETDLPETDFESLELFDKTLSKKFGTQYAGFRNKNKFESVGRVKLDCLSLNNVLGGGLPVGRIIEIFGDTSVGKSTLASHIVSSYQKQNKLCMWVDAEHAIDPDFMIYCGVNLDKLCTFAPNSAEEALEAIRTGIKLQDSAGNPVLNLIVLDSVAALVPSGDLDEKKEMGTTMIGSLARLMSNALKQLVTLAAERNISIILLNQERGQNLLGYGSKSTTCGGRAVHYYCSVRLDLNRVSWLEDAKEKIGQIVSIQAVKNKTSTPFKKVEIPFIFPIKRNDTIIAGVDVFADTVNLSLDANIIQQHGAWFYVPHLDKKVAGLQKVYDYYLEHPDSYLDLQLQLNSILNLS